MAKSKISVPKSTMNYHKIGEVIRKYRNEKRLKLIDLAAKTNMGAAQLSKIENGRMIPTIPTLFSLIHQLNIQPEVFFAELDTKNEFPGYFLIPKADYKSYVKEEKAVGFSYMSILDHTADSVSFQISLVQLSPGSKRAMVTTEAYEYLYVLNGPISYHLGKNIFQLETGDSLFFDGNIPHLPVNEIEETVSMLVVFFFSPGNS